MYYAGTIYEMSNFNEVTSVWLSGFTALAQVLGVAVSIFLVDRVGRRVLVLASLIGVAISLIGLGTSFYLSRVSSEPVVHAVICVLIKQLWYGVEIHRIAMIAPILKGVDFATDYVLKVPK